MSLIEWSSVTQSWLRSVKLPRVQREVLACRFVLDLDVAQTARTLGLPDGTVKSHTARALARLRELLAEDDITTDDRPPEVRNA